MSANFHGSPSHRRRGPSERPATPDQDTTVDVHEENTADLEPATVDIVSDQVPRATIAATAEPRSAQPARPQPGTLEPEPALGARLTDAPPDAPIRPITAREIAATEPPIEPPILREMANLGPLPFGPFVSAPMPYAVGSITADVPARPVAPVTKIPSLPETFSGAHHEAPPSGPKPAPTTAAHERAAAKNATKQAALAPGTILCDRYLLEQVIGCGGTAIVFRARDMLSGKGTAPNAQVAIKTPRPELGDPARAAQRLKHEFEHARLLSHPSIVRVLELHQDDGRSFMTMELVHGKLLSQMLRDWTMTPVPLAYKILGKCAEALHYAHTQNVVHGDFKPGNVFITPEEGVRIVDFGTAIGPGSSDSRIPAGTPTYASPEVLDGATPDRRDDVFSFACVAYELLTGQHPFGRQSSVQARDAAKIPPRAWNLSTPQWLSLLSALSWKREQRPTSVEELMAKLMAEQPPAAAPAPTHVDPEEVVLAELPTDLMPKQRSWGFFAFIVCALLITYFVFQRQNTLVDGEAPAAAVAPAAATATASVPVPAAAEVEPSAPEAASEADTTTAAPAAASPAVAKPSVAAPVSEISFESSSIVTSESSVAAVFLIKRSQPLSGRVSVSWRAVSGTADAGIDFASDATGTVSFADGQAQRAIYVPLRNDLLEEEDETFYVELFAPKSARIGKAARAEAIIRDDD